MNDKVDFDQFANNYDDILHRDTKFFTKNTDYFSEYKINLLDYIGIKSPKRILEFGCGTGRNIKFLHIKYPKAHIIGTDISSDSLSIAKLNNPDVVFFHECDDLQIGKFDLIFVAGVLHHIEPQHRLQILRLLESRLEVDGNLIIFEHNPYNPITRSIVNNCVYDKDAILLSAKNIKLLVQMADFSVIKSGYCLFIPPFLKNFFWFEFLFRKIPLGGQHWISLKRRLI